MNALDASNGGFLLVSVESKRCCFVDPTPIFFRAADDSSAYCRHDPEELLRPEHSAGYSQCSEANLSRTGNYCIS